MQLRPDPFGAQLRIDLAHTSDTESLMSSAQRRRSSTIPVARPSAGVVFSEPVEGRTLFAAAGPAPAFGDFNDDGKADLVLASRKAGDGAAGPHVTVQFGAGDGTFAAPTTLPLTSPPSTLIVRDLDNDGKADDILVASKAKGGGTTLNVELGNGGTTSPDG